MRLGINFTPPHETPEEWAEILTANGFRATAFPVNYTAKDSLIDAYVREAKAHDILIAEVGAWSNPNSTDPEEAARARELNLEQLKLADYVGASCCVNISGAVGPRWDFCYERNYTAELYKRNVEFAQFLIDAVKPQHTAYSLEPMQWMAPRSVSEYAGLLADVDRPQFKVHMDIFNLVNSPDKYIFHKKLIDEAFLILGEEIASCHLKNIAMQPAGTVMIREVPVEEGYVDVGYYLGKIRSLGRDLPVLIEHREHFEDYVKSAKWVLENFGELFR